MITAISELNTRGDQCLRLVSATITVKSLHEGTGRRDLSHEQFTRSVLRNKSQGLPKISNQDCVFKPKEYKFQTGLNSWDLFFGHFNFKRKNKQIAVTVIDHKFRHNNVKVAML